MWYIFSGSYSQRWFFFLICSVPYVPYVIFKVTRKLIREWDPILNLGEEDTKTVECRERRAGGLYTWATSEKKLENTYDWLNGPPKGFWLNRSKENNRNLDFCCSHRWMFFESITLGKMLTRLFLVSNTSSLLSLVSLIFLLPLFLHKPNFQFPDSLPFSSEMCSQLTSWKEEWETFFCS